MTPPSSSRFARGPRLSRSPSACRRPDRRASRCSAFRSSSRTISTWTACRRRPPVPRSPISRRNPLSSSSGSSTQARSSSARRISTSSRPALSAFARLTGSRATRCGRTSFRAGRARAQRLRSAPGLFPFRSGPTPPDPDESPAALNGIVGLKPSLGALSARGGRARLPDARHDLDFRARRRRRVCRVRGGVRL